MSGAWLWRHRRSSATRSPGKWRWCVRRTASITTASSPIDRGSYRRFGAGRRRVCAAQSRVRGRLCGGPKRNAGAGLRLIAGRVYGGVRAARVGSVYAGAKRLCCPAESHRPFRHRRSFYPSENVRYVGIAVVPESVEAGVSCGAANGTEVRIADASAKPLPAAPD